MLRASLVFHRGRYHKGIHCTCGHQFTLRLGLNDVGLVVVFGCICIIIHYIHSIIPKFLDLEPSNIGISDGDWLSHKFID